MAGRRGPVPREGREVYDLFRRSTPAIRAELVVVMYQWWIEQRWAGSPGVGHPTSAHRKAA